MSAEDQTLQTRLNSFSCAQIQEAGARYTPGVDPKAPNLKIDLLSQTLDFLAFDAGCISWFQDRQDEFTKLGARVHLGWSKEIQKIFGLLVHAFAQAPADLLRGEVNVVKLILADLEKLNQFVNAEVSAANAKLKVMESAPASDADARSRIQLRVSELTETLRQVYLSIGMLQSAAGHALEKRQLLLLGPWGTGKTHFLCDRIRDYVACERPALFILAKTASAKASPLRMLYSVLRQSQRIDALFERLGQLTESSGLRFLIVVDGINEGSRTPWRAALKRISDLVLDDPRLSLLVSCRSPLERECVPADIVERFASVSHPGFADIEFDAQAEFFKFYRLPLPEVPLLDEEFSRPLTLKIICEAFRDLSRQKQREGFAGLSSGQKGMTFVFERYINERAHKLEQAYALPNKSIWRLIKGTSGTPGPNVDGFAAIMAKMGRETITRRTALGVIRAFFPALPRRSAALLLDDMRVQGLLDEDVVYGVRGKKMITSAVLRLPYQRFSDHIIARHLLDRALTRCTEPKDIRAIFARGGALHKVFRRSRYSDSFEMRGWAEALIVEFPERVRRLTLPTQELYFYLPVAARRSLHYSEPFISGLLWRAPGSFTEGTDRIVGFLLERPTWRSFDSLLDVLVSVGIRPAHPYESARTYCYLASMRLAQRDLSWSEYLREDYKSPAVRRLLHWVEAIDPSRINAGSAGSVVTMLSLLLTSTVHATRDRATRGLVRIGESHWKVLFDHTLKTLSLDDLYVPERMLAACYGVMLSLTPAPSTLYLQDSLRFARTLYRETTSSKGCLKTYHSRIRDYIQGVFFLACELAPSTFTKSQTRTFRRRHPYPDPFPAAAAIPKESLDDVKRVIRMAHEGGNLMALGGFIVSGRSTSPHCG